MEEYEWIRSRRRTLTLEITRDCRVVVRSPLRTSRAQADAFVADHKNWIARHLDEARRRTAAAPPPPAAADIAALKERARQVLPA